MQSKVKRYTIQKLYLRATAVHGIASAATLQFISIQTITRPTQYNYNSNISAVTKTSGI